MRGSLFVIAVLLSACGSSSNLTGMGGTGGTTGTGGSGGGGPTVCTLDSAYRYGPNGGNGLYQDEATLTPANAYAYTRQQRGTTGPDIACAPALPTCPSAAAIDVSDIMRAIVDPHVQAALAAATPPLYGNDPRPYDGTVFSFLRADGRGFLAGGPCTGSGGTGTTCVAIPAGITRLVADLQALDDQQLTDASCAALR